MFKDDQGLMKIYDIVSATRNYQGARIVIPSGLNIAAWEDELAAYHDKQIIDFLALGWPISYEAPYPAATTSQNHSSASYHPTHIDAYLQREIEAGAIVGPFTEKPFSWFCSSPMLTRPKKTSTDR